MLPRNSTSNMSKVLLILAVFMLAASAKYVDPLNLSGSETKLAIYILDKPVEDIIRDFKKEPNIFKIVEEPVSSEDPIVILVQSEFADGLIKVVRSKGYRVEELREDNSSRNNISTQIFNDFPRYDQMKTYLRQLGEEHKDVVEYLSLGNSSMGNEIPLIKISSKGNSTETKPALFIDAGIHAREWIAPTTALYAIKELVENSANHRIFKDIDIYIVPLLNPDGYELTHQKTNNNKARMWRKNLSRQNDSSCVGVDLNRNFGYKWAVSGTSTDPCSEFFGGNQPESEPETQALTNFLLSNKDSIKVYLTLHSYSQMILYPWGYSKELPQNEQTLKCVARKAAYEVSKTRGTQYRIGTSGNLLGRAAGGSDDWAMAVAKIDLAYTIELPPGDHPARGYSGFAPPASEILPVGSETFEAFKVFAEYARSQVCDEDAIHSE